MANKNDNIERQKYSIVTNGFSSLINSLKHLGVKSTKKISKTNFWQMVIDQFDALSEVLSQIKPAKDGEPGHTATDEELTALIIPLIPEPIPGKTATPEELLALIKPLIPEVKNGETPSDERLLALIAPLIPVVPDVSEVVMEASQMALNKLKPLIPVIDTPEELATKLKEVKKQWVPIDAIIGDFNTKVRPIIVPPYQTDGITKTEADGLYAPIGTTGGDKVVAGTNITIVENESGEKVISSSGSDFSIPQLSSDPVTPTPESAWVLKTGSGGTGGGKLKFLFGGGMAITAPNTGGSFSYKLSYRTLDGLTKRVTLT